VLTDEVAFQKDTILNTKKLLVDNIPFITTMDKDMQEKMEEMGIRFIPQWGFLSRAIRP